MGFQNYLVDSSCSYFPLTAIEVGSNFCMLYKHKTKQNGQSKMN